MVTREAMERAARAGILSAGIALALFSHASAQTNVLPSPSPTPTTKGFALHANGSTVFVGQQTGGPGTRPAEGPGFAAGSPLSPNTPYDLWSSAPMTPGYAGILQTEVTGQYTGTRLYGGATLGLGVVDGSVTNAAYWGESLLPTLNPHLGSTALPYGVVFPTHAGEDDASAWRLSLLGANVGANDGSWSLRGGYFDLQQSLDFVFVQPPLTNVPPSIGLATAESLGGGSPALSAWPSPEPGLPLNGLDGTVRSGSTSMEFTNASLPALPGTAVHLHTGSAVMRGADHSSLTLQMLDLDTNGALISTTTLYGYNAHTVASAQGDLPTSTLGNQHEVIAGLSGSFLAAPGLNAVVDAARSWYDAADVIRPGTQAPGGYYHAGLSHALGSATLQLDGYRFEPRYATAILPYGVPENVWSAAWAWPGVWLKSTYQLVSNTIMGANRQGYRVRLLSRDGGALSYRLSYMQDRQIDPATFATMTQTGFVDGFFLPEANNAATLGGQAQLAGWLAWRATFGTLTLDYVNDMLERPALPSAPQNYDNYVSPQIVLGYSKQVSSATILSAGVGRYAMRGTWEETPVDYGQTTAFAGAEFRQSAHFALLVNARHATFDGLPSGPLDPSPFFGSTILVVEEHYSI